MKVSREQAAQNRENIVDVAGALFRERGYDGVGIADIMQAAGLTHGGFYRHFASKDDLADEASRAALAASARRWRQVIDDAPERPLAALLREYLSERHRDAPDRGCLLAMIGTDAARQSDAVRTGIGEAVTRMIDGVARLLPDRLRSTRRRKAAATLAGMVGALVLARAVGDAALSKEILDAAATELERGSAT
ncbi:TetR/AcrR family transcriptional regulator [Tahibacter soli]|uniref:TetR/AcrR family transcriptional regulator n=1 Tax=Tahibacter soli TaxID=2983605 RepID=A0A9X3YJQ7_9GAMM|nr:TetR/AcrR family transcriptional regulator [Tahibacter soli]MDC8013552.1 TetR/AcrR family transcriptional regulator [Tahibacter soli]